MKYLNDATSQYILMEQRTLWNKKHTFLEICFMKLINCVACGNVAQLQTLLLFVSSIQMERIQQITWTMSPSCGLSCKYIALKKKKKKKGVVRWDLEGPISSGYLVHCSHPFFMSIRIEFLASYSMLSRSFMTPTWLARLFINPEFCQCPLRCSWFWYLQQTACFCCISL